MRTSLIAAGLLCLAGCAGPTVEIVYVLPPDVPVDAGAAVGSIGAVTVEAEDPGDLRPGAALRDALTAALDPGEGTLAVSATGTLKRTETPGERTIRRPAGAGLSEQVVPTLRRRAEARIVFTVTGGGEPIAVEAHETYDSADDPRTRGPLGLARADAPENIPPIETIYRELLAAGAESLAGMLRPAEVRATEPLRPIGAETRQAVERGDYPAAVGRLEARLADHPTDADAYFNLGVLNEKLGNLSAAEDAYRAAGELLRKADRTDGELFPRAERARRRVARVRAHR